MWRYSSGNQRALGIIFTHSALSFNCNSPHPCCEYCTSLIRSLHKKINKPLHKIQSTRLILRKRWKAIKKISNNFIYIIHLPMIFIIFEKKKLKILIVQYPCIVNNRRIRKIEFLTATKRNDKRRGRCRKLVQGGGHEGWYSWPVENGEYWLRGSPGGILVVEGICSVNVGLNGGDCRGGLKNADTGRGWCLPHVLVLGIARSGCVCRACVPRLCSCTHAHFCVYLQCTVAEPVYPLVICTWRSRWLTNKREENRVVKTTKVKKKRKKKEYDSKKDNLPRNVCNLSRSS